MFPFAFEWRWDLGHLIFFGLFYLALGTLIMSLAYTFFVTLLDLYLGRSSLAKHHDEHEED